MNNITLITCIVVLIIHKAELKVVLWGVTENNSDKVTFNCSFSIGAHDCSAEFIYNKETLDTLRESNRSCYHKQKLCSNDTCSCANDCKTFILSVSNKKYTNGDIIGCEVHYMDGGYVLSTTAEIIFNGSEFLFHKTSLHIVAQWEKDSSLIQTEPPDVRKSKPDDRVVIALISVGLVIAFGIPILIYLRRKHRQGRRADISHTSQNYIEMDNYRKFNNDRSGLTAMNTITGRPADTFHASQNDSGGDSDRKFSRFKPGSPSKIRKRDHRKLNRQRPVSFPAIITKEPDRSFDSLRPVSFPAISKESNSNFKRRPASFSANSTYDTKRNLFRSTPISFSQILPTDSYRHSNLSIPSISSEVSFNSTTSNNSGAALMNEVTRF